MFPETTHRGELKYGIVKLFQVLEHSVQENFSELIFPIAHFKVRKFLRALKMFKFTIDQAS